MATSRSSGRALSIAGSGEHSLGSPFKVQGVTERVVWHVVKDCTKRAAIENLAPHDLRRTCARLCRDTGGELDEIQFLLGHVSVQTTEKYLGDNAFKTRSTTGSASSPTHKIRA